MSDYLNDKNYKLTLYESIALGGHSQVFKAELVDANGQQCLVAAKKVRLERIQDAEIAALKQLSHKNIIKFHGAYRFKEKIQRPFIIMEFAENGDLYHYLMRYRSCQLEDKGCDKSRLVKELAWRWVFEAACAIQYLHSKYHCHRDIKSQNYLVMGNLMLKLGDLGLAKKIEKTQDTHGSGTLGWMAPEVIQQQKRSKKSDTFSFGIVVWEIFTTDVPYCDRKGNFHVMKAVCDGERPTIPGDCPEDLANIMQDCWAHDYNNRPDMDTVVQKLQPYQTEKAIPTVAALKMEEIELKSVSPPSSITRLESDDTHFEELLSDKYLLDNIARQLGGEWEQLATYLNFSHAEIYRIKYDSRDNILTTIHTMLIQWRQRQDREDGLKQVVENLSQALSSCKRHDLAQRVLELIGFPSR